MLWQRWQLLLGTTALVLPLTFSLAHTKIGKNIAIADKAIAQNPIPIQRQNRTALIIGNSNYQLANTLANPVNDATDIANSLRQLGFKVILLKDADLRQMEEALENFNRHLRRGGIGLFYFAGHGLQVEGENYLIPVNARIKREQDVRYEAMAMGKVLNVMEDAANDANFIILDACRNNPFSRQWRSITNGLAAPVHTVKGTLIAYATAPGTVAFDGDGRNSPYTTALLRNMTIPSLDVEQMFKQVRAEVLNITSGKQTPWESSSLVGYFAFNDKNRNNVASSTTTPQALQQTQAAITNPSSSSSSATTPQVSPQTQALITALSSNTSTATTPQASPPPQPAVTNLSPNAASNTTTQPAITNSSPSNSSTTTLLPQPAITDPSPNAASNTTTQPAITNPSPSISSATTPQPVITDSSPSNSSATTPQLAITDSSPSNSSTTTPPPQPAITSPSPNAASNTTTQPAITNSSPSNSSTTTPPPQPAITSPSPSTSSATTPPPQPAITDPSPNAASNTTPQPAVTDPLPSLSASPRTRYFVQQPRLVEVTTSDDHTHALGSTYYFTIHLPEDAGTSLQQITINQREGAEYIRFNLEETVAFKGTRSQKGEKLELKDINSDKNTQTVSFTFNSPVSPGTQITIALKVEQNPQQDGVYIFGVTAFPMGDQADGQFLGIGRLSFSQHI
jgi:uncharacterized caspase-like protein